MSLAFVSVATATSTARAQDTTATAEVLFAEGQKAMEARNFDVACAKFRESIKLEPGVGAMLWLGDCYEQSGKTASAWAQYRAAQSAARSRNDGREKVADRRARDLEPKLSTLTIEVEEDIANLGIKRDGAEVGAAVRGTSMPVDPGPHTIEASAPGRQPWSTQIDVKPNAAKHVVRVPKLAVAAASPAGAAVVPVAPGPTRPSTEPSPGWPTQKVAGVVVAGVGVVGIGLGAFFGLSAISNKNASNENGHCGPGNACDAEGLSLRDDAGTQATISTVAMAIGATALVGGGLLYFLSPSSSRAVATTSRGIVIAF